MCGALVLLHSTAAHSWRCFIAAGDDVLQPGQALVKAPDGEQMKVMSTAVQPTPIHRTGLVCTVTPGNTVHNVTTVSSNDTRLTPAVGRSCCSPDGDLCLFHVLDASPGPHSNLACNRLSDVPYRTDGIPYHLLRVLHAVICGRICVSNPSSRWMWQARDARVRLQFRPLVYTAEDASIDI